MVSIGGTLGYTPSQHDIQQTFPVQQSHRRFAPFQSPHSTTFGFFRFCAPPPPGIAGSSTPHQPILQASSSDEEEQTDDMNVVQHYGFEHHVSKKTTRYTSSDWP
ncbi:hypothetical protein M9H77_35674 [Catharanthus roseus]|uniref:Uncharacterized protein n=1 Tax=Catharanthus roseus TaxID=4058 RepID=A0ACB9ZPN8_CATRO|nr:hypothetical protein M9H77_35674 [Catharanthus roseus]